MYIPTPSCQIKNLTDIYMETFGYIENGFFVDVGAFDGEQWSNTYTLALADWSGIAIEAHPDHYAQLRKKYLDDNDFFRIIPDWMAIANPEFHDHIPLYKGGSISTIKPERVKLYNDIDWSKSCGLSLDEFVLVPVATLNATLYELDAPRDFEVLSVDVEGAEIDVFKGFSIEFWQPKLVIVETHEQNEDKRLARKARWINAYMCKYGYENIQNDTINSIYRKNDG